MFDRIIAFFVGTIMFFVNLFGINYGARELNIDRLEKFINASQAARLESGKLSGAHLIVNQGGKTVFNEVYGMKSIQGSVKMQGNEVYRIASMTKPVTALALLIEYEKGNIDIYADVADYLPEYKNMSVAVTEKDGDGYRIKSTVKANNSIKVYQLVSHTSGIASGNIEQLVYKNFDLSTATCKTASEYFATQPLSFEPGTKQEYSTGAFDVAARIIELKSGLEFSEYLKVNIFDKLGMTDTTFEPGTEQWARMVSVHGRDNDGKAVDVPASPGCVFGNYPVTYHAAGAALASTANDYIKFAQMLLNGGKAADGTVVVGKEMIKLMSTPVPDVLKAGVMEGNEKWGLGVRVIMGNRGNLPKGSFGWSGAYGSHFWVDPANEITAVYMKNSAYDGGAGNQTANEFEKDVVAALSLKKLNK